MSHLPVFSCSGRTAYRLLTLIGLPAVFALTFWLLPNKPAATPPSFTDHELFVNVVNGMRAGGSYYDVYGNESRAHGYPTRSVFNWRQPLLLPILASIPKRAAILLLVALAVVWTAQ